MTKSIGMKEIHVNGSDCQSLMDVFNGLRNVWRTTDESVDVLLIFERPVEISFLEIQFWLTCFPSTVRLSVEKEVLLNDPEWVVCFRGGSPPVSGDVNRVMRFEGPFPLTSRFKLELSGGKPDPFYRLYKIGIKKLSVDGSFIEPILISVPVSFVGSSSKSSEGLECQERMVEKLLQRSDKRIAPLYAFPDARTVFEAIKQSQASPWQLLSWKSRHKEKLSERLKHSTPPERFVLPRFYPPSLYTIPSRKDLNL